MLEKQSSISTEGTKPMSDFRQTLDDSKKDVARTLFAMLEPFKQLRDTMPMQYVLSFLLVAMEEGLGVVAYAERAGVPVSVMSRHLMDIGDRNRNREPGLGLVTSRPDPMDLRVHQYILTPVGRALIHKIERALERKR